MLVMHLVIPRNPEKLPTLGRNEWGVTPAKTPPGISGACVELMK